MGSFGGFYKGDTKKKKKKGSGASQNAGSYSNKPIFVLPKVVDKKKKKYE